MVITMSAEVFSAGSGMILNWLTPMRHTPRLNGGCCGCGGLASLVILPMSYDDRNLRTASAIGLGSHPVVIGGPARPAFSLVSRNRTPQ